MFKPEDLFIVTWTDRVTNQKRCFEFSSGKNMRTVDQVMKRYNHFENVKLYQIGTEFTPKTWG